MNIVVTGGGRLHRIEHRAGAHARGEHQIIAVDNLSHADKIRNLAECDIAISSTRMSSLRGWRMEISTTRLHRSSIRAPARTRWKPTAAM